MFSFVYNFRMSHKKGKLSTFWFKAVISSLSKLIMEFENFFYKGCSVRYANQLLNQKTSFGKFVHFGMLFENDKS